MSIESIAAVQSSISANALSGTAATAQAETSFDQLVEHIGNLNSQIQTNDAAVRSVALGETENLHQVIMSLETTRLNFDLMLQVRNKVLDAYQELMRMQI
jgi:flagellar hook-basal body complex protein FliE